MIKLTCQVCAAEYLRVPSAALNSKHCSRICHNKVAGRIGGRAKKPGVNQGIKRPYLTLRNLTNNPAKRGPESRQWKGNSVGYIAIHNWAHRHVGLKEKCERCNGTKRLEMANKSQQYKRELKDWQTLCKSCHTTKDVGFRRNGGVTRKLHRWTKRKTPLL